ncbi:MAG: hypothetical protein IK095_07105, partial [Oscillospiraceae bacterium]|nr:hypothetical protein [Oscillospiraceae bacterium]
MKGKKKKRKRRKIHPLWKLLICLLLIGSMAMCIQPWLSVKIDTPTGKDKSIEAFLGDAGIDVRYELSNDVAPALRELSDEMYEQTGKRLDAPMAMDLLESLLAGKYAPLGMLRDLERAEALTEQGRTICRLLLFTGSDETRELRDTLDQVDTIVSGAQLGLKILLGAAGLLGAIALLCALTDHRFGLLPYALLSGLLAAGLRAVCTALNSLAASFGLELLDTAELYFPYPTSTLGTDVFRPEPYPAYGAVLALAAFILALATAKRVTAAPAEAAPAAAGAPGEEPVGTAVPPRSTQSPAELPRQTAAAQPRMRPQPAPAGAATEPKRQATGSAARPAERSATGWTCPGCGTRQPDAARYCGVC